ncbi:MAG: TetR/AcrR family transcriptional regulator [Desulfurellaceae bacterium]|nr:TetR/AcrR family transcriptional regulator [Desulfurellaceae bacterium]
MAARISHADRSELTRRALLHAAQELFATQGYAATSAVAIARRAKRSQGALQYHFPDKVALFQAVYEEENLAFSHFIVARIQDAEGDLWQREVVTACQAFVERAADPRVRRFSIWMAQPYSAGPPCNRRGRVWSSSARRWSR